MPDGSGYTFQAPSLDVKRKNALADACMQVVRGRGEGAIKRALVCLWSLAAPATRRAFMDRIEPGPDRVWIAPHKQFPGQNDPDLEEAWRHWPYILRNLPESKRGFAYSIRSAVLKRKALSPKQIDAMKRMYVDYRRWADGMDDPDVIEDDEEGLVER